jgi:extradiol dioxygenase family protein
VGAVQPILHLSIPVRDLEEARAFYVDALGCEAARAREGYQDVWFYGMQVTLQEQAGEAGGAYPGSVRHFGVTLGRDDFDALSERLAARDVPWLSPVSTDDEGTPTEQTKAKFADPSGNVIEIKTYADVASALEISSHPYPEAIEHGN